MKKAADEFDPDELSRLYRHGAREVPPARLDDTILAAAGTAVENNVRIAKSPFSSARAVPISAAAVLLLSVTLVVFMSPHGDAPREELMTAADRLPREADARREQRAAESAQADAPALRRMPAEPPPATTLHGRRVAPRAQAPAAKADRPATPDAAADSVTETAARRRHALPAPAARLASILAVDVKGHAGAYEFVVTIDGPAGGCAHYADWWEVVSENGELLYRRMLPAARVDAASQGGPIPIQPDTPVWVRAHTHPDGYGGAAFSGSVEAGFRPLPLDSNFAPDLARQPPLPPGCKP